MFWNKIEVGKKVKDTKQEYYGDKGIISDIRRFPKVKREYVVIKWEDSSKHGEGFRNYRKEEFGKRFQYL